MFIKLTDPDTHTAILVNKNFIEVAMLCGDENCKFTHIATKSGNIKVTESLSQLSSMLLEQ